MKKYLAAFLAAAACFGAAAYAETYTFSGTNIVTDGSPNDVTGAQLTEDITVTTSGLMNRKYAAVTDLEHNSDAGTFPAKAEFTAEGSYIYLAAANANDGAVLTLNLPEIRKGSRVTLTFAKPTVTNNGSTLRNTNDPYAYFKIADRYISINGDNFDKWRTESVVIGEDTDAIEFHCDKWGAAAISKIDISEGDGTPLHSLNIRSTQFANLNVNGIKFCADAEGALTIPSLPENERLTVLAEKEGYEGLTAHITIGAEDKSIDLPLRCLLDAAYYESDFGNSAGVLELDGYYDLGVETMEATEIAARVTFKDGGVLNINDMRDEPIMEIKHLPDGIYVNGVFITPKDNMEFKAVIDRHINAIVFTENGRSIKLDEYTYSLKKIGKLKGEGAALDYIRIAYPKVADVDIFGPDTIYVTADKARDTKYEITPAYKRPAVDVKCSVSGIAGAKITDDGLLTLPAGAKGTARICVDYNNAKTYKSVTVKSSPKIVSYKHDGGTMNLGSTARFEITDCLDETGAIVSPTMKIFRSSDENVIRIDENGKMTAVGKGRATITADAYTGASNPVSADYVVDCFGIAGISGGGKAYAVGTMTENGNIREYKALLSGGGEAAVEKTEVKAVTMPSDGRLVTTVYNGGTAVGSYSEDVAKGDTKPAPSENTAMYLFTGDEVIRLTEADTTAAGYSFDAAAGELFEIVPVYEFKGVGDTKDGVSLGKEFENGLYNITFKKGDTKRGDIYVNGFMAGNNVDQADADRKVTDGAVYTAEDVRVKNGEITVSMCDGSTLLDSVSVVKQPSWRKRPQRLYIIGDSLVCSYYGSFEKEVGGGRTGWGQVIGNYLTVPVTNLAQSGQYAKGLFDTAFPSIIENGEAGDIALIECGYNDRSYSTREELTDCVKSMIAQCRTKGIEPILVTPNASEHDYKPSVSWSSYVKDAAVDTGCKLIDLSQMSYDLLHELYGDNEDNEITKNFNLTEVGGDTLHTSYAGANVWAMLVAKQLQAFGYDILSNDNTYSFTDTEGHEIRVNSAFGIEMPQK